MELLKLKMVVVTLAIAVCVYMVEGAEASDSRLDQGSALGVNQELNLGGVYRFTMQDNCNLVLTHTGVGALWSSGTKDRGNPNSSCFFVLQSDGNAVVYGDQTFRNPLWSTNTCCRNDGEHHIEVQRDGNTVMYNSAGQAVWHTDTRGR